MINELGGSQEPNGFMSINTILAIYFFLIPPK
jgi:hypothetical protein